ncbi:MAG TPA: hypothetical protein PLJ47_03120 [Candidatus Hydrogenedentes bacterium]|nr:hypothetical protein [Candidatus Hydrogenedentota bacterium]HRK33563.1 hypothetical protein [Candidatus Hydrogenedentota bacterium]
MSNSERSPGWARVPAGRSERAIVLNILAIRGDACICTDRRYPVTFALLLRLGNLIAQR